MFRINLILEIIYFPRTSLNLFFINEFFFIELTESFIGTTYLNINLKPYFLWHIVNFSIIFFKKIRKTRKIIQKL